MRARDLATFVTLTVLVCVLFSGVNVTAGKKVVGFQGQVHSLDFSKSVPGQLNYQGFLVDATDSSAVTAILEMTFRLFDSETKGAELWSETHSIVAVNNGLFQVLLGSVMPFPDGLLDGTTLWLQTEVGTEVLSPRKPLVSVAYSQRTEEADHALLADDADQLEGQALMDLDGRWVNEGDLDHLDAADGDPSEAIYVDDVGKVGIGTSSPLTELDVNGSINATTYYGDGSNLTGISGTADADWTIDGDNVYHETGNVGIGTASPISKLDISGAVNTDSLYQIDGTTVLSAAGTENILVGIAAGGNNTGTYVTCVGDSAGHFNQGNYNTFIGRKAGRTNTVGQRNTFVGNWAGRSNTEGNDNAFLGCYAGRDNTLGGTNTFAGDYSGANNTTGDGNTFVGFSAGDNQTDGNNNSFFGMYAGRDNGGDQNTFIGVSAGGNNEAGSDNTFVGQSAGYQNTTGEENTFLGAYAGVLNNTGTYNTFVGYESGYHNGDANYNTFLGHQAGYSNSGAGANTFLGSHAGYSNTNGYNNTYVGGFTGSTNEEGYNNVFVGVDAGLFKGSGNENTFIGYSAGRGNSTGDNNTFLGHGAGYSNDHGEGNVFVGHNAGYYESGSNKLLIANGADTSDVLIYGDFSTHRLAFGTLNPDEMLHIENSGDGGSAFLKIETSHPSNWHEAGIRIETPQNRWHLRMDDDLNNQIPNGALGLRSQDTGVEVMTWAENGNVGIGTGTTSPTEELHVVGDIYCTGKLTSDGGNDPPYVLYNKESRETIIARVAVEVPEDKRDGAVLFWNGGRKRFEVYLPENGEFRDLDGNLLSTVGEI